MRIPYRYMVPTALASLAIGAGFLAELGSSTTVTAANTNKSCYPTNEWVGDEGSGAFRARAHSPLGGGVGDGEIEVANLALEDDFFGANVVWSTDVGVTGNVGAPYTQAAGALFGDLQIKVTLPAGAPGNGAVVTFKSKCNAESSLDEGAIEIEMEGTITGFPDTTGPVDGVATLEVSRNDDGTIHWRVGIERGLTCADQGDEISVSGNGTKSSGGWFLLAPTTGDRARAALPIGKAPDMYGDVAGCGDASF